MKFFKKVQSKSPPSGDLGGYTSEDLGSYSSGVGTTEILKKVRELEIKSKKITTHLFTGEYLHLKERE
jgi:hypothetical protein